MRLIFFLSGLSLSVFLLAGSISPNNTEKEIKITPSANVKQGQTVFIDIRSPELLSNPYLVYGSKKIKLYKTDKTSYRGLIGIEADDKVGKHKIVLKDDTSNLNDEESINVISGKFPIQNLRVTGKNSGLTATRDELMKIQMVKDTITDNSYWATPPFNSPTKGCIISVYGLNRYYNGKSSGNYHKGLDIKAPQGQEMRAITGGRVLVAEQFRLNGGTVAIDHGHGVTSFYLHMSKILVKPGDIVGKDQAIGKVGSTGFATGPHLHWGLYINGIPVNPMDYWIKSVSKC